MNAILEARDLLKDLTPLVTDCGELCDHACCNFGTDIGAPALQHRGTDRIEPPESGFSEL